MHEVILAAVPAENSSLLLSHLFIFVSNFMVFCAVGPFSSPPYLRPNLKYQTFVFSCISFSG